VASYRVYRPPMSHLEAVHTIRQGCGTHFDPLVVAAFETCLDQFETINLQYKNLEP
jgi:putative two-component system response regulator